MKKLFILALAVLGFFGVKAQQPGTLDENFGIDGFAVFDITGSGKGDVIYDIMALEGGKVLVVGPSKQTSGDQLFTVARLNADGSLDATFGQGGVVAFNPTGFYGNFPEEIALTSDESYVIGGYTYDLNSGLTNYILVKLFIDGSRDVNFGVDGVVLGSDALPRFQINTLKTSAEGKIVAGGYLNSPDMAAVMMFNEDGSIDVTFGENGVAYIEVHESFGNSIVKDLAIQEDGKIVVAGMYYYQPEEQVSIQHGYTARFNADGTLDATYGTEGIVEFSVGDGPNFMETIGIDPMGKIVVGGDYWVENEPLQYDCYVARFNDDGTLDSSFGTAGMSRFCPKQGYSNYVVDIATAPDSTYYVTGPAIVYPYVSDYYVACFDENGNLNADFGNGGFYLYESTPLKDIYAIDIASDNKIVLGGSLADAQYFNDFMVTRIYSDITGFDAIADIDQAHFSIYPNPSADFISITLSDEKTYKAEIVDMSGRVVMVADVNNGTRLNVSGLNAGNYFLVLTDGANQKVARINKQ